MHIKTTTRKSRALAWVLTLSMVLNLFPDIARAREGAAFTGSFDGDKHLIRGLRSISEDYGGLFGYISGATIRNLGLEDVEISSNGHAGGIAGQLPVLKGSSAIGDPPSYLDDNWGGDGISES